MKTFRLLSRTLFLITVSLAVSLAAFAQNDSLPAELTEKSSLADVINWLDKMNFAQARVGLNAGAPQVETGEVITSVTRYSEWAVFAPGFKLAKIEGCRLILRNDDVKLLSFATKYPNSAEGSLDEFRKTGNGQSKYAGEFFIPLNKLKAAKAAYRPDKAKSPEAWQTEFKFNSGRLFFPTRKNMEKMLENQMKIEIIGAGEGGGNDSMTGGTLTFSFDDKQQSENFYAAFSRAITLCKDK